MKSTITFLLVVLWGIIVTITFSQFLFFGDAKVLFLSVIAFIFLIWNSIYLGEEIKESADER